MSERADKMSDRESSERGSSESHRVRTAVGGRNRDAKVLAALGNQVVQSLLRIAVDAQPTAGAPARPQRPVINDDALEMMDEDVDEVRAALTGAHVSDDEEALALRRVQKWDGWDAAYGERTGYHGSDYLDKFLFKLKMKTFTIGWNEEWTNAYDQMFHELEDERLQEFKQILAKSKKQGTSGPGSERMESLTSYIGKRELAAGMGIVKAGGQAVASVGDAVLWAGGIEGPTGGLAGAVGEKFDESADIVFNEWIGDRSILGEKGPMGLNPYEFGGAWGKVPYGLALGGYLSELGAAGQAVNALTVGKSAFDLGGEIGKLRAQGRTWAQIAAQPELWAKAVSVVAGAVGVHGGLSGVTTIQDTCKAISIGLDATQAGLLIAAYLAVDDDLTIDEHEKAKRKADLLADAASAGLSAIDGRYGQDFEQAWQRKLRSDGSGGVSASEAIADEPVRDTTADETTTAAGRTDSPERSNSSEDMVAPEHPSGTARSPHPPEELAGTTSNEPQTADDLALDETFQGGHDEGAFETSERLKRGNTGENLATHALAAEGHNILSYKPGILGTNQGGIDIVTIKDGVVYFIDNKALTRSGNVSSVSALTTNFNKNKATALAQLKAVAIAASPQTKQVLESAVTAIENGNYKRVVTNANVIRGDTKIISGVSQALQGVGIEFLDVMR